MVHGLVQSIMIFIGQDAQQFVVSLKQNIKVQAGMLRSKVDRKDPMHRKACIMTLGKDGGNKRSVFSSKR